MGAKKGFINKAEEIHDKLECFSTSDGNDTQEHRRNLSWVCEYLDNGNTKGGKYLRFLQNDTFFHPKITVPLCRMVMNKNRKALNAKDKNVQVMGSTEEVTKSINDYRHEIHEKTFINEVYEAWYKCPNNFIVVDKYDNNTYAYILDICRVLDYQHDNYGNLQYLVFTQQEGDDEVVIKFDKANRTKLTQEGEIIEQFPHRLGYCPAKQLSTIKYKISDCNVKQSLFVEQLALLRNIWYEFVNNAYATSYLQYPITWFLSSGDDDTYEQFAEFVKSDNEMSSTERTALIQDMKDRQNESSHVGAGETVEITQDNPNVPFNVPVGRVAADTASLQYAEDRLKRMVEQFMVHTMGSKGESINNQAINEKQVEQGYQSEQEIYLLVAGEMEKNHKFILDTVLKDQFGDQYQGSLVKYGDDFFTLSLSELWEQYNNAREAGLMTLLQEISKDIINVKYQYEPKMKQRENVKNMVIPFYLAKYEEITTWHTNGTVTFEDWYINTNSASLINRFEMEYFALNAFNDKGVESTVLLAKEKLYEYAKEYKSKLDKNEPSETNGSTEG